MPKKKAGNRKKALRVLQATERLSPSERKKIFARNLDQLIRIVGLRRNEAAEQIGIPYTLVRRLATAGVSRPDERTEKNIQKIVEFFGLEGAYELWQPDLISWLLNPDYTTKFIDRFRESLARVRYQNGPNAQKIDPLLLTLIDRALAITIEPPTGYSLKVEAILASSKAEQFMCLIDDYYELVRRREAA